MSIFIYKALMEFKKGQARNVFDIKPKDDENISKKALAELR